MKLLCYFSLCLFALSSCRHGALMTSERFGDIKVGTPISEVEKVYGKPLEVRHDGDRTVYEYFERIQMGTETIEMRKYYFVVKDGKIVNKFTRYRNQPGYDQIYSDNPFPDQTGGTN